MTTQLLERTTAPLPPPDDSEWTPAVRAELEWLVQREISAMRARHRDFRFAVAMSTR